MTPAHIPTGNGTSGFFLEKSGIWAEVRLPAQGDVEACAGYRAWNLIRAMAVQIVTLDGERCQPEDLLLRLPRPDWEQLAEAVARQMFEAGIVKEG